MRSSKNIDRMMVSMTVYLVGCAVWLKQIHAIEMKNVRSLSKLQDSISICEKGEGKEDIPPPEECGRNAEDNC